MISVIIPLYNHAPFIEACIESVANQTFRPIELIIIDDNSTDDSAQCASAAMARHGAAFASSTLIRNSRNRGAAFSLNRGIALARGETLAFLNSDDLYASERLSRLSEAMTDAGTAWAFSGVRPIDALGQPFWASKDAHRFAQEPRQLCQALPAPSWALLEFQASISTGNVVVKRDLALQVGGFPPLSYCHDWAFVLACAWHHEPAFVAEPLYAYRFHGTNSFSGLAHVADHDAAAVLRAHCMRVATGFPPNPHYPAPRFGSVLYEMMAKALGLEGLHASLYQPYAPHHRTIAHNRVGAGLTLQR